MLEDMPLYLMKTVGNPIFSIKPVFFSIRISRKLRTQHITKAGLMGTITRNIDEIVNLTSILHCYWIKLICVKLTEQEIMEFFGGKMF